MTFGIETADAAALEGPVRGFLLVIFTGGSPKAFPLLKDGEFVLGRGKSCDVVVDHASVSREHAALRLRGNVVTIRDLGSRNGTRVAGRSLVANEPSEVGLNQIIDLGAVVIAVRGPTDSRSAPPTAAVAGSEALAAGPLAAAMERAHALADLVAPTPVSVLLLGETGVGKTAAAERLHARSGRSGPLVKLNCAAVPEALLEGELFGYERGAFTGAQAAKPGLVEVASNGTLLLDEIGDMPLATQAKLLQVVEQGEVTRLGAIKTRRIDVRFLAATHRNITAMVQAGTFRADLYYRVNGISITIPPLRERKEEIIGLAERFLALTCAKIKREPPALGAASTAALLAYAWPGNLRELRNAMDRVALFARGPEVPIEALGLPLQAATSTSNLRDELDSYEKAKIVRAMEEAGGNQTKAAELVGLPLRTFVKRLTDFGLTKARKRGR